MNALIRNCLEKHPSSQPCLLDDHGAVLHTYGSLLDAVVEQSRVLARDPVPGSTLMVPAENSPEFIIRALAAFESGYSVLPVAESATVSPGVMKNLPEPSFLRWTSGSVASPKLAAIPVSAILHRVEAAHSAMPFNSSDSVLWLMPMADHFLVSILLYLYSGASIVLVDEPTRPLDHPLENVTTLYGMPHHLIQFLHHHENSRLLPGVRQVFAGGEAIPLYLNRRLQERFNLYCTPFWGLIEAGVPAMGKPDATSLPGSVGATTPGYLIEARASDAGSLPELHVDGPGLYAGYLENGDFIPRPEGPLATGDAGYQDKAGNWVLTGRLRQSFDWNGRRWLAQELEALALQHSDVIACRLCLSQLPAIRLEFQSSGPLPPSTLEAHCRNLTSHHLDGIQCVPVESIPRTRTSKVDRMR